MQQGQRHLRRVKANGSSYQDGGGRIQDGVQADGASAGTKRGFDDVDLVATPTKMGGRFEKMNNKFEKRSKKVKLRKHRAGDKPEGFVGEWEERRVDAVGATVLDEDTANRGSDIAGEIGGIPITVYSGATPNLITKELVDRAGLDVTRYMGLPFEGVAEMGTVAPLGVVKVA
ncbi:hypothetical protein SARC_12363 [Sphaeroforma arctica JP610]|uniref:Uncharacterized protein n=1 Tax=Sphaeroforma arctica JP610 TaxID=667725 RepID=A0A0L0FGF3_9EUKA|nr:hypothetical protein SARC_12363 [Sphaeroforma arctica JP610]KNC75103.1 hypothetical protein SARC_12363 [Sphaeroforma arctica JP610]|eukprot:XP_014149005.1 hypothetical protein SARC_12363 [Sphaeroforma arctica JP610]